MGRAKRVDTLGAMPRKKEDPSIQKYIEKLQGMQTPLQPQEKRALQRAHALIRGRGWPRESIEAFFLEADQLAQIADQPPDSRWLPSMIGPTAISVPRPYIAGLNDTEITRILLHEMSHARSAALPGRSLPDGWQEDLGLYQLSEGLTEIVAERIIPLPARQEYALLHKTRQEVENLCRRAGLDQDAVERMSAEEAIWMLSENLDWSFDDLSDWMLEVIK